MWNAKMKIKEEDYNAIKRGVKELLKVNGYSYSYVRENVPYVKNKDIAAVSLMVRKATIMGGSGLSFICQVLYKYMDDSHLDTVYKNIAKDLLNSN